jgi:DNA-binding CsgD family transcriptional regulator
VLKNEAGAELVEAIRTVCRGGTFMSLVLSGENVPQPQRCADLDLGRLTGRERDVLRLLAQGRRTKDIADDVGISVKAVETYRGRDILKLGIDNLVGLVKFAYAPAWSGRNSRAVPVSSECTPRAERGHVAVDGDAEPRSVVRQSASGEGLRPRGETLFGPAP